MTLADPRLLLENDRLAFIGEPAWTVAALTREWAQSLSESINPSGRPNADVLRGFVGIDAGRKSERWQIDFPSHLTAPEAALYTGPFKVLEQRHKNPAGQWWINPHANSALRNTLARLDRFLATPVENDTPAWAWIEGAWLPDGSLLAVARDDDFTQGVLQSRLFALWWGAHATRHALTLIVGSFPFPWPPAAPFSSLTGLQQDLRFEVSRAARNGTPEQISAAVATAYGWPAGLTDDESLTHLQDLNRQRAG